MSALSSLSDAELIARLPALVQAEGHAMAEVIEHLVEVERRRLYLEHATSSLYRYCIERLGYADDAALKRHRVARLALRFPQVLGELRAGTIHLTGLFLLSTHLSEDNVTALLGDARGKSRRQIEALIAWWFPRPDVAASIAVLAAPGDFACSGAGKFENRARLEPLSPGRVRVEFTARAEFAEKLERAHQLLSHALPSGDLGELFERALDALLETETRRRLGVGQPRKQRATQAGLAACSGRGTARRLAARRGPVRVRRRQRPALQRTELSDPRAPAALRARRCADDRQLVLALPRSQLGERS